MTTLSLGNFFGFCFQWVVLRDEVKSPWNKRKTDLSVYKSSRFPIFSILFWFFFSCSVTSCKCKHPSGTICIMPRDLSARWRDRIKHVALATVVCFIPECPVSSASMYKIVAGKLVGLPRPGIAFESDLFLTCGVSRKWRKNDDSKMYDFSLDYCPRSRLPTRKYEKDRVNPLFVQS